MKSWQKLLDTAVDATDASELVVPFRSADGWDSDYGFKKMGDGGYFMVEKSRFQDHFRYVFSVDRVEGDLLHVYTYRFSNRTAFTIHIDEVECDIFETETVNEEVEYEHQ